MSPRARASDVAWRAWASPRSSQPRRVLAESVRGTSDRFNPARMPGSRDRAQSSALATPPYPLHQVLSSELDASWPREGRARPPTSLANVRWADHRDSGSRRPSSPLRTASRVSASPAGAPLLNVGGTAYVRIAAVPFRQPIRRPARADRQFSVIGVYAICPFEVGPTASPVTADCFGEQQSRMEQRTGPNRRTENSSQ
jgi:hypothetical protein